MCTFNIRKAYLYLSWWQVSWYCLHFTAHMYSAFGRWQVLIAFPLMQAHVDQSGSKVAWKQSGAGVESVFLNKANKPNVKAVSVTRSPAHNWFTLHLGGPKPFGKSKLNFLWLAAPSKRLVFRILPSFQDSFTWKTSWNSITHVLSLLTAPTCQPS